MAWFLLDMGGGRGGGAVSLGCFVRGKGGRDRGRGRGRWMISTIHSLLANPPTKTKKKPYLRSYPLKQRDGRDLASTGLWSSILRRWTMNVYPCSCAACILD